VCLGFLAAVTLVYNLWRAGAAAAKPDDAEAIASWGRPIGPRIDLEREKKTLLKAIKESEFDHQMGKLSTDDAAHMVAVYRARAIEIIKALEHTQSRNHDTAGLSVREQIEREVRARLEVEGKTKKKVDSDVVAAEGKQQKKQAAKQAKQVAKQAKSEPDADAKAETEAKTEAKPEAEAEAATVAAVEEKAAEKNMPEQTTDGDAMVTQSESTPAKEATS
jgi:hypothetical protein